MSYHRPLSGDSLACELPEVTLSFESHYRFRLSMDSIDSDYRFEASNLELSAASLTTTRSRVALTPRLSNRPSTG